MNTEEKPTSEGEIPEEEPRRSWSVRALLLTIALASTLGIAAFGAFLLYSGYRNARSDALRMATLEADYAANEVLDSLDAAKDSVLRTASEPGVASLFQVPGACSLSTSGMGTFADVHLHFVAPDGRVVCSSLAEPQAPRATGYAGVDWLLQVPSVEGLVVSRVQRDPLTGKFGITLAAPVRNPNGEYVGVFATVLETEGVAGEIRSSSAGRSSLDVVIVDPRERIVISNAADPASAGKAILSTAFTSTEPGERAGLDGEIGLYASAPILRVGWVIFVGPKLGVIREDATAILSNGIAVLAGLVTLLLALTAWINRRIASPLQRLSLAINAAAREDAPGAVSVTGPAEIAEVVREFNALLSARSEFEQRITHQALHDSLTDLPNRVLVADRLGQALRDRQVGAEEVAVMILGVDRFKLINESLGNETGDRILIDLVQRVREEIRPGDTLARFGGDEFLIICEQIHGGREALGIAERVQNAVRRSIEISRRPIVITASVGIALNRGSGDHPEDLLRSAGSALRSAKERGGSRVEVYDEAIRSRVTSRLDLENDLRGALEHRALSVHYQPKVELSSGRVVGLEALLRWNHPKRGLISPAEFVSVAEDTGLIIALGALALGRAIADISTLKGNGEGVKIAVNISKRQIDAEGFARSVQEILQAQSFDPSRLILEITEGVFLGEETSALEVFASLKGLGVGVSLDDFGTGFSSLSYLRRFPIDELKIDRVFTAGLGQSPDEEALVAAILAMGEALSLEVVAEGVETEEQLRALVRLGCKVAQGELLGKPASIGEVTRLIDSGVPVGL